MCFSLLCNYSLIIITRLYGIEQEFRSEINVLYKNSETPCEYFKKSNFTGCRKNYDSLFINNLQLKAPTIGLKKHIQSKTQSNCKKLCNLKKVKEYFSNSMSSINQFNRSFLQTQRSTSSSALEKK